MAERNALLLEAAERFGTPAYVYDMDEIGRRARTLKEAFGGRLAISYAVKANPNLALLRRMASLTATLDVSSYGEVKRALAAGCAPGRLTFSGPAKRAAEVRGAVVDRVGELVLENWGEAEAADRAAAEMGRRQPVLIRINPASRPKKFGVSFAGRASQFGFDEEVVDEVVQRLARLKSLNLVGFHIFSGVNSLDPAAIAENFQIMAGLFERTCGAADTTPAKLVFGAGFGVPYTTTEQPLDLDAVVAGIAPILDALKAQPRFSRTTFVLELGRWLVGPAGWLLTSVVAEKASRGVDFRACDAGFNNHLAAFGLMGTVIRRNWPIANLSNPRGETRAYTLVGPLCTSIDVLASDLELPEARIGDVLVVESSGAYGFTASPTRFISHPEPAEVLIEGGALLDASEAAADLRPMSPDRSVCRTESAAQQG